MAAALFRTYERFAAAMVTGWKTKSPSQTGNSLAFGDLQFDNATAIHILDLRSRLAPST